MCFPRRRKRVSRRHALSGKAKNDGPSDASTAAGYNCSLAAQVNTLIYGVVNYGLLVTRIHLDSAPAVAALESADYSLIDVKQNQSSMILPSWKRYMVMWLA
jgi:hypothetical protein